MERSPNNPSCGILFAGALLAAGAAAAVYPEALARFAIDALTATLGADAAAALEALLATRPF